MTDLDEIKRKNRERNTAIMKAFWGTPDDACDDMAPAISRALFVVAEQWRARGEELKRLKRKGHVGTKASLDFAAEQLEDVAGSLRTDGAEWTYAASEAAGVAVSLAKDGTTDWESVQMTVESTAMAPRCGAWFDEIMPDGTTSALRCLLAPDHAGDHTDHPGHPASHVFVPSADSETCMCGGTRGEHPDPASHHQRAMEYAAANAYALNRADNPDAAEGDIFPGQCPGKSAGERCMLPDAHTGLHIGTKGGRWPQTSAETTARIAGQVKGIVAELTGDAPITGTLVSTVAAGTVTVTAPPVAIPQQRLTEPIKLHDVSIGPWGPEHPVNADTGEIFVQGTIPDDDGTIDVRGAISGEAAKAVNAGVLGEMSIIDFTTDPVEISVAPGFMPSGHVFPPRPVFLQPREATVPLPVLTAPVHAPAYTGAPVDPYVVPGEPKPYQSVSSIETMAECGLKYRMQYRDRLPETPAWWNVGGHAFHSYAEWVETLLFGQPHPTAVAMLDTLATGVSSKFTSLFNAEVDELAGKSGTAPERWRTAAKGKENRDWWLDNGTTMAAQYLLNRAEWGRKHTLATLPDGSPALEVEFMHNFGGIDLKGYIDQLWIKDVYSAGVVAPPILVPRDLKAGSRKPSSSFQLGVYDHAARAILGVPVTAQTQASYYMARKSEEVPSDTTRWTAERIGYRAVSTVRADQSNLFVARPSEFCASCPFQQACPVMGE